MEAVVGVYLILHLLSPVDLFLICGLEQSYPINVELVLKLQRKAAIAVALYHF